MPFEHGADCVATEKRLSRHLKILSSFPKMICFMLSMARYTPELSDLHSHRKGGGIVAKTGLW